MEEVGLLKVTLRGVPPEIKPKRITAVMVLGYDLFGSLTIIDYSSPKSIPSAGSNSPNV